MISITEPGVGLYLACGYVFGAVPCARSRFWGCHCRRTGMGVTTVSNSLILGGRVTKVLKNCVNNRGWKG